MYCSSCGSAVTAGLSYCNRCGAELNANSTTKKSDEVKGTDLPESLVWAIVSVSVGGLGVMIGLMAVMKNELHFANGMIFLISLLSFALLLGAEAIFIWLLLSSQRRALRREREGTVTTQFKEVATKELGEPQGSFLPEPAVSVTEHTTHTLEPVYRRRRTDVHS